MRALISASTPILELCMTTNRQCSEVPPSSTRTELQRYARDEFERHRGVSDIVGLMFLVPWVVRIRESSTDFLLVKRSLRR